MEQNKILIQKLLNLNWSLSGGGSLYVINKLLRELLDETDKYIFIDKLTFCKNHLTKIFQTTWVRGISKEEIFDIVEQMVFDINESLKPVIPVAPLLAVLKNGQGVDYSIHNSDNSVTSYAIYKDGVKSVIATNTGTLTNLNTTYVSKTIVFSATCTNSVGESPKSNEVSITIDGLPMPVPNKVSVTTVKNASNGFNFTITDPNTTITVTGYSVYYKVGTGSEIKYDTTAKTGSINSINSAYTSQSVTVYVIAKNATGNSVKSDNSTVTVDGLPMPVPNKVSIATIKNASNGFNFTITDPNTTITVTGYSVYYKVGTGSEIKYDTTAKTGSINSINGTYDSQNVTVYVIAKNTTGNSVKSDNSTVNVDGLPMPVPNQLTLTAVKNDSFGIDFTITDPNTTITVNGYYLNYTVDSEVKRFDTSTKTGSIPNINTTSTEPVDISFIAYAINSTGTSIGSTPIVVTIDGIVNE